MSPHNVFLLIVLTFSLATTRTFGQGQIHQIPYTESFDSVLAPALPPGWTTTTNRNPNGDFTTTTSTSLSDSNAVLSTNATISQILVSPTLDFSNQEADSLIFYERRSASHNSGLLVQASIDNGTTFPFQISDTIKNSGTTSYIERKMSLPSALSNQPSVKIRWYISGNGTGTSGTIRFDNVSITGRAQIDAGIIGIYFLPPFPKNDDSVIIEATIKNNGTQSLTDIPVEFYNDTNNDALADPGEFLSSTFLRLTLQPSETTVVQTTVSHLSSGQHLIIVRTVLSTDLNHTNDNKSALLSVGVKEHSIVINEIMYEPKPGNAEYVELYNNSGQAIDVREWRLSDMVDTSATSKLHVMSHLSLVIRAEEYLVLASDSSILREYPYLSDSTYHLIIKHGGMSLNNSGDDVILSDFVRQTIDSVHYVPGWHNAEVEEVAGQSLERINPNLGSNDKRNWSTSANPTGGTPGKQNSLFTTSIPGTASVSFSPNPFSPDGDGIEDMTIMQYNLPATTGLVRVRIYDAVGRIVRILADREPSGSHGELIWNGMNDNDEKVKMGIYIVLLEALDGNGGEVQVAKGVVVVAAKM